MELNNHIQQNNSSTTSTATTNNIDDDTMTGVYMAWRKFFIGLCYVPNYENFV